MIVKFKEKDVKQYLDKCIRMWRLRGRTDHIEENRIMADYYIDAYQSVRISLFGETLPVEEPDIIEV